MPILCYSFKQSFKVPAKAAYRWCIDYSPDDPLLMGEQNAKREIIWLSGDTVVLKETFSLTLGSIEKQKLVHLYPERLMWVSTHISGQNKHSQFIYEIETEGKDTSHLKFNAHHFEKIGNQSPIELKSLTDKLCTEDSNLWKRLAKAMEKEYRPKTHNSKQL